MKNLVLNNTYLIRYGYSHTLDCVTVLSITDKAYQIRWNNNINNPITWMSRVRFDLEYSIVEDITKFDYDKSIVYNITVLENSYERCPNCGGTGYVSDTNSTGGIKICPNCWGSKMVLNNSKI